MILAPQFWSAPISLAALLLLPIGALYGAITQWRMGRPARGKADVPVICIGNLSVGGAGKTPTALALADWLIGQGFAPGFLSRGYSGRLAGPVRVDPASHTAADVGDEPLMLAAKAPTIIARDRVAGAKMFGTSVDLIIMDDGFQNPSLFKDLKLIVIDKQAGIGNGLCLPAGPLRAPVSGQLRHADVIIAIGGVLTTIPSSDLPVFAARIQPDANWAELKGRPVLAYAGIGRPEKFFQMLAAEGALVEQTVTLADHALPDPATVEKMLRDAQSSGLQLVTTQKDATRIAGIHELSRLLEASFVAKVTLAFEDAETLGKVLAPVTTGLQAQGDA